MPNQTELITRVSLRTSYDLPGERLLVDVREKTDGYYRIEVPFTDLRALLAAISFEIGRNPELFPLTNVRMRDNARPRDGG